jgi:hypothetical protein
MKPSWSVAGQWWIPPNLHLAYQTEIWITEGIFDAIALWSNGLTAVSAMSSNQYPEAGLAELAADCDRLKHKRPTLIWAFDTGKSGEEFTEKFARRAEQDGWTCTAAQPPHTDQTPDWNDLHQQQKLTPQDLKRYRHNGDLLLAPSAKAKALLIHQYSDHTTFALRFRSRLFWCKIDIEKYHKICPDQPDSTDHPRHTQDALSSCMSVSEIANCYPEPLYYQYNPFKSANHSMHSRINKKTTRCWIFEKPTTPNTTPNFAFNLPTQHS